MSSVRETARPVEAFPSLVPRKKTAAGMRDREDPVDKADLTLLLSRRVKGEGACLVIASSDQLPTCHLSSHCCLTDA